MLDMQRMPGISYHTSVNLSRTDFDWRHRERFEDIECGSPSKVEVICEVTKSNGECMHHEGQGTAYQLLPFRSIRDLDLLARMGKGDQNDEVLLVSMTHV